MGELSQSFTVGLVALIVIEFLRGFLDPSRRMPSIYLAGFLGEWFVMSCVIGVPTVWMYHRFLSREKKEESEKVE